MGVACGDLDGDGRLDLAVTNFYGESTTLFHNLGSGLFADHTAAAGLAAPSRYLLGFGIAFLDANNDGWLDLMTANGHVSDMRPALPYADDCPALSRRPGRPADRRHRRPARRFSAPRGTRTGRRRPRQRRPARRRSWSRRSEPLVYFHNRTEAGAAPLRDLPRSRERDRTATASGAVVTVSGGHAAHVSRAGLGGGSYQSAGDPRLHFGLGTANGSIRSRCDGPPVK